MASDIISQVGKGERKSVTQALADTGMFRAPKIAGDDDSGLINMDAIKNWDAQNRTQTIIPAGSVAVQPVAVDPLAAIKAKYAAITNTKIVPTIAGLNPAMVQRPATGILPSPNQAAPAIAGGAAKLPPGVLQFQALGKPTSQAGVSIANGRGSDWSNGSSNSQLAIANAGMSARPGRLTEEGSTMQQQADGSYKDVPFIKDLGTMSNRADMGRTYDEQVAHAKEVNANTMQQLGNVSAKQKWEQSFVGAENANNPLYRNAMLERKVWAENNANNQAGLARDNAKSIAGITADTHKYAADQGLAGHKYTADANVKAHELTAIGNVEKAKIAGQEKQREQGQKDYTDRIKGLVGDWSKLNLPQEYVPKLNEFAQIHADAENPTGKTFLMAPNRDGGMYAALPKQYESQYQKLLQTMPHKDAAARVYSIAQQNGHVVANIPDFRRFMPTSEAIKQQNQIIPAGA